MFKVSKRKDLNPNLNVEIVQEHHFLLSSNCDKNLFVRFVQYIAIFDLNVKTMLHIESQLYRTLVAYAVVASMRALNFVAVVWVQ